MPEHHNNKPTSPKMKIHAVDTKNMSLMDQALNKAETGVQTRYSDFPKACKLHLSLLIYTRQHSTNKYLRYHH